MSNDSRPLGEMHSVVQTGSNAGGVDKRLREKLVDRREKITDIVRSEVVLARADDLGVESPAVEELRTDLELRKEKTDFATSEAEGKEESDEMLSIDALEERIDMFERAGWDNQAEDLKNAVETMEANQMDEVSETELSAEYMT